MEGRNSVGLNPAQEKAIELIMAGRHYKDVAEEVGVSVTTVGNWRSNKNFAKALNKQKLGAAKAAQGVMAASATYAAQRIIEMIDDKEATRTQLAAAVKVYESAIGSTIEEFEARIQVLEDSITRQI
jgi:transcriptional regulator with XRE-family HTH domain